MFIDREFGPDLEEEDFDDCIFTDEDGRDWAYPGTGNATGLPENAKMAAEEAAREAYREVMATWWRKSYDLARQGIDNGFFDKKLFEDIRDQTYPI